MKFAKTLLLISVAVFFVFLTIRPSTDFDQDLGRHLVLGKIISETGTIPRTNLFSYTQPDFPFINHHWLSEVIFYQVSQHMGVESLLVLRNVAMYIALGIAVLAACWQQSKKEWIAYTVLVAVFAYSDRIFIRPEFFGFVLFSVFLWFLVALPKRWYWYLAIPIMLALWINLHLTFVFGVLISLLILLKTGFDIRGRVILLGFSALLLNPWGIQGVLYPLTLFGNYGYPISENMSLPFMLVHGYSWWIIYLLILTGAGLIFTVMLFVRKKNPEALLLAALSIATFMQLRHEPFLSLTYIVLIPPLFNKYQARSLTMIGMSMVVIVASIMIISGSFYSTLMISGNFGWGYTSPYQEVINKSKNTNLPGNIFNNFDIAGYLIYGLYPNKKIFIDNRPEAYPADFFQKIYIPLQNNEALRKRVFKHYDIRTVIFAHSDRTHWAAQFLYSILHDPSWKLIYLDSSSLLFVNDSSVADIRVHSEWYKRAVDASTSKKDILNLTRFFVNIEFEDGVIYALKVATQRYP